MIFSLFRRSDPNRQTIDALYGAIVARAREPVFYTAFAVPDTVTGRFEMVLVHVVLLVDRLKREAGATGATAQAMAQDLVDRFFADMDAALRELGVGDLSVPKKIKGMAEAYKGRSLAYGDGLSAGDASVLAAALARNLYPDGHTVAADVPQRLAVALRRAADALAAQDFADLAQGRIQFGPVPEGMT
jgi:cytochrome b pre-mRNA-processing protein 3